MSRPGMAGLVGEPTVRLFSAGGQPAQSRLSRVGDEASANLSSLRRILLFNEQVCTVPSQHVSPDTPAHGVLKSSLVLRQPQDPNTVPVSQPDQEVKTPPFLVLRIEGRRLEGQNTARGKVRVQLVELVGKRPPSRVAFLVEETPGVIDIG